MYGNLVPGDTVFTCPHGGRAVAAPPPTGARDPAVRLDGLPLATAAEPAAISGCPHDPPCATIRWTPDDGGVRIDGAPVLLDTTPGQCCTAESVPQGPPRVATTPGHQGVRCR